MFTPFRTTEHTARSQRADVRGDIMDEKKRQRMMRVFRVVALIMAVVMIIGIIVQAVLY